MRHLSWTRCVAVVLVVGGAVAAGVFALSGNSGAGQNPVATDGFSVFSSLPAVAAPSELKDVSGLSSRADFSQTREAARHLGRHDSRLFLIPSDGTKNLCYALEGATSADLGMVYCYAPGNPSAVPALAGEHFSVVAPSSTLGGKEEVQVFGVADDDVTAIRVQVAGGWRAVPLANNGFYIDLDGVRSEDVGRLEATLRDGSKQVHDIRTATRIP